MEIKRLNEIKLNTNTVQLINRQTFSSCSSPKPRKFDAELKEKLQKKWKRKANIWSMKEIKQVDKGLIKLMIDASAFHLCEC